jgi:Flp pilus assembly protein TadD
LDRAYALLASETARQPDDLDLLYEQAMMADRLNRFQEMERLLRVILEKKPDYHHALNALGYALADRNERLPEAKELIEKALALAPEDPFITDSLGWVKFRLGRLDEAEGLLRKAFSKRADAEIAIHLAEVLWVQGRLNDAKSMFQQAKDLQADHPSLAPTMLRLGVQW